MTHSRPRRRKALAATNAMLKMKKIVIADLQRGRSSMTDRPYQ
jgi:hypothetical protein